MNIIYTIHGHLPDLSMGGPARIVALLLEELDKLGASKLKPYLIANQGILEGNEIKKVYFNTKGANLLLKKFFGNIDTFSAFLKFLFLSRIINTENGNPKRLKHHLDYSSLRSEKCWAKWKNKIKKECIIHSHLNIGALPFLKSKNPKKHKIISTYHTKGSLTSDYASSWNLNNTAIGKTIRDSELLELQKVDIITFPSKGALKLMEAEHPEALKGRDIRIVYNGIDVEKIETIKKRINYQPTPNRKDQFLILNVSQHVQQKRIDILLKAVAALKNDINIALINIGAGPLFENNRLLAENLGIIERVDFLGMKSNEEVISIMSKCNAFVMPSENVIFDLVTLEAMAVGIPIIVSGEGGNLECIRNGIDGIFTKVDNIKSVVDAIRFVYFNKEKVQRMKDSAGKHVRANFSSSVMFKNYLKLYEEVYPYQS